MRRVVITGPAGTGASLQELAERCGADAAWRPQVADGLDVVVAEVPNDAVGPLVDALDDAEDVRVSFASTPVLAIEPNVDELLPSVKNVSKLSPTETVLGGLQSIGSWKGFLVNAVMAGAIVWIALLQEAHYLLVGAMLVAPLGGPAINGALSIARGELHQLARATGRFVAGVVAGATTAALLTLAFGIDQVPPLMYDVTTLTRAALVLPVAAGVVGAMALLQSENNSLLSGATIGILVAAALAPPMGILGIGLVLQDWQLFTTAAYLLVLQYVVIAALGAVTFVISGVGPDTHPKERSTARGRTLAGAGAAVAAAALVAIQFATPVDFVRQSVALDAAETAAAVLDDEERSLVDLHSRFTGQRTADGRHRLLVTASVSADDEADPDDEAGRERELEREIAERIESGGLGEHVVAHASIEFV